MRQAELVLAEAAGEALADSLGGAGGVRQSSTWTRRFGPSPMPNSAMATAMLRDNQDESLTLIVARHGEQVEHDLLVAGQLRHGFGERPIGWLGGRVGHGWRVSGLRALRVGVLRSALEIFETTRIQSLRLTRFGSRTATAGR
jgi:hypothetical protein